MKNIDNLEKNPSCVKTLFIMILLLFIICLFSLMKCSSKYENKDLIDYKKASFVYNEYIECQKEYIEELESIIYFTYGKNINLETHEKKIDECERVLDSIYSVNVR